MTDGRRTVKERELSKNKRWMMIFWGDGRTDESSEKDGQVRERNWQLHKNSKEKSNYKGIFFSFCINFRAMPPCYSFTSDSEQFVPFGQNTDEWQRWRNHLANQHTSNRKRRPRTD